MLFLAAAAIAASAAQPPASGPVTARVQARVTIRILAGATVRFGEAGNRNEAIERTTIVRTEGSAQVVKLMEFQ
jgi:hypothetical protein